MKTKSANFSIFFVNYFSKVNSNPAHFKPLFKQDFIGLPVLHNHNRVRVTLCRILFQSHSCCIDCKHIEAWNLVKILAWYGLISNSTLKFLILFVLKNTGYAVLCTHMKGWYEIFKKNSQENCFLHCWSTIGCKWVCGRLLFK